MEPGYSKAYSDNLPKVDIFMVGEYLTKDNHFNADEIRNAKTSAFGEIYGDAAISFVQLKREDGKCHLQGRVNPNPRLRILRKKSYKVHLVINEVTEEIETVSCLNCETGCKHALAFLMWIHRKSEEEPPTIVCYWKNHHLADKNFITVKEMERENEKLNEKEPEDESFLRKFLNEVPVECYESFLMKQLPFNNEWMNFMSLHRSMILFLNENESRGVHEFCKFLTSKITEEMCQDSEKSTREQSRCQLWFELKYGRITSSQIHRASKCCNKEGTFLMELLGTDMTTETPETKRINTLKQRVIKYLEINLGVELFQSGLIIDKDYPILGASPDALSEDFVLEIKCPRRKDLVKTYIKDNGIINDKFMAQIYLQMFLAKKSRACFCVVDPDFKETNEIRIEWVELNQSFMTDLVGRAMTFWAECVFPKLLNSVE